MWDRRRGGDPDALVAVWKHCRTCEVLENARTAGPPEPDIKGWHLTLQHKKTGEEVGAHDH